MREAFLLAEVFIFIPRKSSIIHESHYAPETIPTRVRGKVPQKRRDFSLKELLICGAHLSYFSPTGYFFNHLNTISK